MRTKKLFLRIMFSLVLALGLILGMNFNAYADSSGTVGTASYTIDDNGVLTVGSGSFNKTQWRNIFITTNSSGTPTGAKTIAKNITKVVFEDGATITDSAAGMFYGWTALQEADLSKLNTSNVTDMWAMFRNCQSLKTVDLNGLNTANVTYMDYMFYDCRTLTVLDLSTFNTKNVTTMNSMFYSCKALEEITFGDNFDTSKVTDMYCMFYCCYKLKTLDLSHFSTSKVTKMNSMFYYCEEVTTITVGSGWNTDNVTAANSNNMFGACTKLVGGAGTAYNSKAPKDKTYAKIDGGTDAPGYFTSHIADTYSPIDSNTGWCVDNANNNVYLIYRFSATEEDLKNYDFISILNTQKETMVPGDTIAEGEDGYEGKFNTVYTAIQFPDNSEITAGENEYLIGFEISGLTTQPKNFSIITGVNE